MPMATERWELLTIASAPSTPDGNGLEARTSAIAPEPGVQVAGLGNVRFRDHRRRVQGAQGPSTEIRQLEA